ncbi:S1C family serine protease [Peptoniphilus catoniae]|uniref:S1C family serine protease n=1 Tax=Peptoniphilus catoniae TaxID=1660341 RepID=UPI0010FF081F|nr:trypsin-like peptidase domain-containing protein [Peptoniphilus catoniae]
MFDNNSEEYRNNEIENRNYQRTPYERDYDRRPKKSGKGVVILALVFSLIGGVIGSAITNVLNMENMSQGQGVDAPNTYTISTKDEVNVATAVADKALSSVVGITTKGQINYGFFGTVEAGGSGSGIVVDSKGYILTNAHVVKLNGEVVKECSVLIDDGTTLKGRPIWVDSGIDVAIVKVNPQGKKLVPAELGDSSKLKLGQTAIAIGNPLDMAFQRSVSQGIVSGLDRYVGQVDGGGYMTGLIQTDASINAGNSGGPLLNEKGQVIGINTVKVSSAEGIGFAIPINSVKPIIKQVIETGDYKSVSLGVLSADIEAAKKYISQDIEGDKGLFVIKVYEKSPAAKAGIEAGDIITKIGDNQVNDTNEVKSILYKYSAGDTVKVEVMRGKKKLELDLKFEEYQAPVQDKLED